MHKNIVNAQSGMTLARTLLWVLLIASMCIVLMICSANNVFADTVTLYPTANVPTGTVTNPTNVYADDGAGAIVDVGTSSSHIASGFDNTNLGTISDVTVWVKYLTTGVPSNDSYAFDAAIDGSTFSSSIVATNTTNQPTYTSANLSLGALSWAQVGTLAVQNSTTKSAGPDGYSVDWDVAYIVVTYTPSANTPPSLTITQPDGVSDSVEQGTGFNITYNLSDTEDIATVDFYFETDGNGSGGTPIAECAGQAEGSGATCAWDTTGVTPGDYYVYGVADDTVNTPVTVVSSGVLTITAPACAAAAPTLLVSIDQNVKSAEAAVYMVTVTNNDDVACPATDFELSINSETDANNAFDPAVLNPASPATINLAPGASDNTITLTVTGNGTGVDGNFIDVELLLTDPAAEPAHTDQTQTPRTTIANYNPLVHSSVATGSTKWVGDGGWGVSGGKYGEFTCATCHAKNTGNIKRVKTTVSFPDSSLMPSGATTTAVGFSNTKDGQSDFGDDTGGHASSSKICEVCHTQNKFHNYDTANNTGGLAHENQQDCTACHLHKKAFKAGCDSCHGNPPVTNDIDGSTNTGLVHNPAPTGGTNPASAGAHGAHAVTMGMDCLTCHKGNTMPTVSNTIQMGFEVNSTNWATFGDTVAGGSLDVPQDANLSNGFTYTSGDGGTTTVNKLVVNNPSCSVYCHADWTGANGQTTVTWTAGATVADDCNDCHGGSAATPPTAGSHVQHAGASGQNMACTSCHPSYSDTAHIDGDVAWDVSSLSGGTPLYSGTASGATGSKAPSVSYGSCSDISCHSDGFTAATGNSPVWGTAAGCTACHLSDMATGSHTAHLADNNDCGNCHADAVRDTSAPTGVHVNTNVDVYDTASGDLGYPTTAAYNSASWSTCTAASCHDDGTGTLVTTPTWGNAVTDCTECHEGAAMVSGGHNAHLAAGAVCTNCHDAATNPGTETAPASGHRDLNIDTLVGLGYTQDKDKNSPYETCATASCHNDGRNGGLTQTWGNTINNCAECHATVPTTAGHSAHVGATFGGGTIGCGDCHTGAVQGTTEPTANHRDGFVNAVGYSVQAIGSTYTNCASASCHQTGQATDDFVATSNWDVDDTNCTQCHAASPTTGSHAKHIASTNACDDCHGANALKDTSYNDAAHGDLNVDVTVGGYTVDKALGSAEESCASISCHSDGLSGTPGNTPTWGAAGVGCSACHEETMTTGSHTAHLNDGAVCANCHDGADPGTTTPPAQHTNSNVDVYDTTPGDLGYPQTAGIGMASWTTCNAASCHDDGTGSLVTTPAWSNTAVTDCTECHEGAGMISGGHNVHIAAGYTCSDCHDAATDPSTETAPATGHRDLNIDTLIGLGYTQDKDKNSAYETCATVTCHSNGLNATGSTPTWGGAGDCTTCHASDMATGSHDEHLAAGAVCGDCHNGAIKDSDPGTAHVDGNVDVVSGYATADAAYGIGTWTTCNAASCHDDGTGTLITTPAWNTASACTECHAAVPATGAHATHFSAVGTLIDAMACANCHGDAVQGSSAITGQHGVQGDGDLDVYDSTAGDLGYTANVGTTAPLYNTETCNTSYCHGDAMPKGTTTGTTNAPTWGMTNGDGCTFCHDMAPTSIAAHVGKTLTQCIDCHGAGAGDVNASGTGFTNGGATHMDGVVQGGGDNCLDCHAGDIDGAKNGVHLSHVDKDTFLSGKTVSGGDYGTNGWYTTTWVNGAPMFGCGECHPAGEGTSHPTAGLNVDLDPTGETPPGTSPKSKNVDGPSTPTYTTGSSVTCQNVYCHSDGTATPSYALTPNWYGGTVSGNCNDCHGNSPSTNAHSLHAVAIHYDTLYDDDGVGLMAKDPTETGATGGADAAHGNSTTSDTIGCQTCHNDTVAAEYNSANSICTTCHAGATGSPAIGDEKVIINTAGSTHVNTQPDVVFANMSGFKSKAQLRNDITTVTEVDTAWARYNAAVLDNTAYKYSASYDQAKNAAPAYNSATLSCSTVDCHNGNAATWTDSNVSCMYCHTSMPQ